MKVNAPSRTSKIMRESGKIKKTNQIVVDKSSKNIYNFTMMPLSCDNTNRLI